MSSIKEQVIAQKKGQYSEMDDKYLSVLKQYNCDLNDEEVAAEVKKILDEKVAENETMEVKKFLFGSIELTSLHTEDTEESILKMIEKVNQFAKDYPQLPHVATVCTYPNFAGLISQSLEVDGVEIAVVSGNFPFFTDIYRGKDSRDRHGHQRRRYRGGYRDACRQVLQRGLRGPLRRHPGTEGNLWRAQNEMYP